MKKVRECEEKIIGKWEVNDLIMDFRPHSSLIDHPAGLEIYVTGKTNNLSEVWNYYLIEQNEHVMIDYTPENSQSRISHIKLLNENMMIWHTPVQYEDPIIEVFKRIL